MVSRDTNRFDKGRIIRAVAILLALICFGCLIWQIVGVRDDPVGTTIGDYEGMTRDEIQEALNRTVEENMMTVSIASTATINEDANTIEDVYEPYLLQLGFIARTPRGRVCLKGGYEHLGIKMSEKQRLQTSMFDDE